MFFHSIWVSQNRVNSLDSKLKLGAQFNYRPAFKRNTNYSDTRLKSWQLFHFNPCLRTTPHFSRESNYFDAKTGNSDISPRHCMCLAVFSLQI